MSISQYNENLTLAELLNDPAYQNRNSDITTEDFRALLAEEITVEDILWRRGEAERAAQQAERDARFEAAVIRTMADYDNTPTRSLLYKFKKQRSVTFGGSYDGYDPDNDWRVAVEAMRRVLNTREHVPNSHDRKHGRREAALKARGQGKSKNR